MQQCPECGSEFWTAWRTVQHIRDAHGLEMRAAIEKFREGVPPRPRRRSGRPRQADESRDY